MFVKNYANITITKATSDFSKGKIVPRMFWEQGKTPDPVWIAFKIEKQDIPDELQTSIGQGALTDDSDFLKEALSKEHLGFLGVLATLALAFLLGALHALSPGHGKTLVAAYLVGSKGTVRHALALGILVTFTHVFSVIVLGLVALWAAESVLPERLAPWLGLAAGSLVLFLGVWMIITRMGNRSSQKHHHHEHEHHSAVSTVSWKELFLLGLSGGMVPCLSATVVLLFAIYMKKTALGLLLIVSFSLGLAATLVTIGIVVVKGKKLIKRFSKHSKANRIVNALPAFSACAIFVFGLIMVAGAVYELSS